MPSETESADARRRICKVTLDERTVVRRSPEVEHERAVAIFDLIEESHFAARGVQAECIRLSGAMELAPTLGLCRRIVDLVASGQTLKVNNLVEIEHIADVSARLVVNRAALKTDPDRVGAWVERIREAADAL